MLLWGWGLLDVLWVPGRKRRSFCSLWGGFYALQFPRCVFTACNAEPHQSRASTKGKAQGWQQVTTAGSRGLGMGVCRDVECSRNRGFPRAREPQILLLPEPAQGSSGLEEGARCPSLEKARESLSGGCGELGWLLVLPPIPPGTAGRLLSSQPGFAGSGTGRAVTDGGLPVLSMSLLWEGQERPQAHCWHSGMSPEECSGWEMTAHQGFGGEEHCSSAPVISD